MLHRPIYLSPKIKRAMEDFVRNFILENPEVLVESVNRMHAKEQQQKEEGAKDALKKNSDYFYKDPSVPEVGKSKRRYNRC